MNSLHLWLGVSISALAAFFLAWLVAKKLRFFSLVDPTWAFGVGVASASFLLARGLHNLTQIAALIIILAWSLRLGTHLTIRLARHFPQEDRRYQALLSSWSDAKFLGFFLLQAVSVLFLTLPCALIATNPSREISLVPTLGITLAAIGWLLESLADAQLKHFRAQNPHAVCNVGLWSWSRHPNYFGEWLVWLGLALIACSSTLGWLAFLAPLTIGYLILFVTGIPPAEASSLASKGNAYRHYQTQTSRFFPLPPKSL